MSVVGPGSHYAAEYYFDYPPADPLVRTVLISPDLLIDNVQYNYVKGDAHYKNHRHFVTLQGPKPSALAGLKDSRVWLESVADEVFLVENVEAYLDGRPIPRMVNPEALTSRT